MGHRGLIRAAFSTQKQEGAGRVSGIPEGQVNAAIWIAFEAVE